MRELRKKIMEHEEERDSTGKQVNVQLEGLRKEAEDHRQAREEAERAHDEKEKIVIGTRPKLGRKKTLKSHLVCASKIRLASENSGRTVQVSDHISISVIISATIMVSVYACMSDYYGKRICKCL